MGAGLGHVQRAMLTRLAACDQTTESLADLASRSVIGDSLSRLASRGLARVTETVPAAGRGRGGKPRNIWSITPKGRDVFAGRTS